MTAFIVTMVVIQLTAAGIAISEEKLLNVIIHVGISAWGLLVIL